MKIQLLVAVAGAAALAGCDRHESAPVPAAQEAQQQDQALVRVVHAIPQAPEADIYAGAHKAFSGVRFGTATSYEPIAEKEFMLSLKPVGQPTGPAFLEAKEGIDAGRLYTIVALSDRDGAAKFDVLTDEPKIPAAGKALIRIVHADPNAGEVQIFAASQDKAIIDGIDYGSPVSYTEVDPADVTVRVTQKMTAPVTSKRSAPSVAQSATLEAGKAYTLVVAPAQSPDEALHLIKIDDTHAAQTADRSMTGGAGKVRAIQREDSPYDESPARSPQE